MEVAGRVFATVAAALCWSTMASAQLGPSAPPPDPFAAKNRVFVLTDIGNEPDDQMSLVRLLLYSNELDIEGIAAVTSNHLKDRLHDEIIHDVVRAYGTVRSNLLDHATGWPTAAALDAAITTGPRRSGMAGIDPAHPSPAATALIAAVDRPDPRPLWVSIWGGPNTLAEALSVIRQTRSQELVERFAAKLRVYAIADQDDSGPWIRRQFPTLQYVVSPSGQPDDYAGATWTGISGDRFYGNDAEAADGSEIDNGWLDARIRKGPLGSLYPKVAYIMEGDTPSFLGLTANGLDSAMSPAWGGWGGRYIFRQPYGETRAIWTQGGMPVYGVNSRDRVVGVGGRTAESDQATIWRWRDAFQNDFAARIDWTIKPFAEANHPPRAVIAGYPDTGPITIDVTAGRPVTLDAGGSTDPDRGQNLHFRWFLYREAGARLTPLTDVGIEGEGLPRATLSAPAACRPAFSFMDLPCPSGQAHIVLEVSDDGQPALTSYRRIILRVGPAR
jgi:hypothetical protein